MDFITVSLVLLGSGVLLRMLASSVERKKRLKDVMLMKNDNLPDLRHQFDGDSSKPKGALKTLINNAEKGILAGSETKTNIKIEAAIQSQTRVFQAVSENLAAKTALNNAGMINTQATNVLKRGLKDSEEALIGQAEDAEIKRLESLKKKLALERDIAELKKPVEPRMGQRPRRIPKMERIAQMRKQQAGDHEKYADDVGMQSLSDADWDDKISRVMEESD